MRYFKILCVVLFASFLVACHEISSGTVVDKYIDEPHTTCRTDGERDRCFTKYNPFV